MGQLHPEADDGNRGASPVPSEPMQEMVSRALLLEESEALQLQWLCAEGFIGGDSADAHIVN